MRHALFTLFVLAAPRAALACPVCFGQSDSPMAIATNTGVIAMLGIVVAVLSAFAMFFVYLIRRAKLAEQIGPDDAGGYPVSGSDPREGTASC